MAFRDFLCQQFGRSLRQTGDDTEPSRIRDRAREFGKADIVHSTLNDRMFDIEQFGDGCFHVTLQTCCSDCGSVRVKAPCAGGNDITGIGEFYRELFQWTISNNPAAPMPPPMHMVTTPYLALRRRPSIRRCPVRRDPVMP